jgi:HEAT repeat protein
MVMNNLQEYVDQCVAEMSGPNAFRARHSLAEAGPAALPLVIDAFNATEDQNVRLSLVQLISEYRSTDAVPFLKDALRDSNPLIWRSALEGFVILGTPEALHALHTARATATDTQRWWVDEAIAQINASLE